jgi:type I site-specific restriction-modification system R (restriction) subunit
LRRRLDDYLDDNDFDRVLEEIRKLENTVALAVESLRKDIEDLRKRLDMLESKCRKDQKESSVITRSQLPVKSKDRKNEAVLDYIKEKIGDQGYVMASSIFNNLKVKPRQVVYIAKNSGLKVIEAGGDYIITSIGTLVELESRLSNLHSTDVNEAIKKAGDLSGLFEVFRKYGMVYYDARIKGWKVNPE